MRKYFWGVSQTQKWSWSDRRRCRACRRTSVLKATGPRILSGYLFHASHVYIPTRYNNIKDSCNSPEQCCLISSSVGSIHTCRDPQHLLAWPGLPTRGLRCCQALASQCFSCFTTQPQATPEGKAPPPAPKSILRVRILLNNSIISFGKVKERINWVTLQLFSSRERILYRKITLALDKSTEAWNW